MANLVVRNIDDKIVKALKERAWRFGHSIETEHRLILTHVLLMPEKKKFSEVLASMPNVGKDSDFERLQKPVDIDVFN